MATYHWLAHYYDHLFEYDVPFRRAHRRILDPILPGVRSACDLGCGTGTKAAALAARGIKTFAVDLSPTMCRLARTKAKEQGKAAFRVIRADMRDFALPQQVDLITCEYDALNHVPDKSDLPHVLKSVAAALEPGGYFAFDVNNRLSFERIWSHTWFIEKDPVAVTMHGGHEPGSDRAWINYEWFIRDGKSWNRHHERIEEVCWSETELRHALAAAGFDRLKRWDASPFFNDLLTRRGNRTFWLARKAA